MGNVALPVVDEGFDTWGTTLNTFLTENVFATTGYLKDRILCWDGTYGRLQIYGTGQGAAIANGLPARIYPSAGDGASFPWDSIGAVIFQGRSDEASRGGFAWIPNQDGTIGMVMLASGYVGIGGIVAPTAQLQVERNLFVTSDDNYAVLGMTCASPTLAHYGHMKSYRCGGGDITAPAAVANGCYVAGIQAYGYDGGGWLNRGALQFVVNGTVDDETDRVDMDMVISTGQTSLVERMRVASDGTVTFGGGAITLSQQTHIADPSGGATQDAEARAAIGSILDALEAIGLVAGS